ncbi:MAG: hypothetical protein F6K50_28235 [Moorea sp. SIO3I7]|uniref:hypothetical protein n=1 Tax=Moorena sp. SIO4A5 TaxID=2607838 RepID=UPI0013C7068B|nr:hypothetical protein [Moorena sp. SIO4A5]NEN99230.1 hypothetical protein [Moorena sp. SIO3I7]NEO18958.1 hypothetical protein [Moorena sp. SIO4A5]
MAFFINKSQDRVFRGTQNFFPVPNFEVSYFLLCSRLAVGHATRTRSGGRRPKRGLRP